MMILQSDWRGTDFVQDEDFLIFNRPQRSLASTSSAADRCGLLIFDKQQTPERGKFKKMAAMTLKELTVNIHEHRLSAQSWLALLALILCVWFIFDKVAMLLELTWLRFGAFILSVTIRPIADLLANRHIPRGVTVLLTYGVLLTGIIVVLRLLIPVVFDHALCENSLRK